MNESLKEFICKSENIRSTSSTAEIIYSWVKKTNIAEKHTLKKEINFSWAIDIFEEKDIFVIHFDEFFFRDDKCEIKYDIKTNSIDIFDLNYKNGEEIFSATISNINKGI